MNMVVWGSVVILLISITTSIFLSKKIPTLLIKLLKIFSDMILGVSLFVLFISLNEFKTNMIFMGGLILLLIQFLLVIVEWNKEIVRSDKKYIGLMALIPLLLMFPLTNLYRKADDIEKNKKGHVNYEVIKAENENKVKLQIDNEVELYNNLVDKKVLYTDENEQLIVSGKTNPNSVVVLTTDNNRTKEIVRSDERGYFYHKMVFNAKTHGEKLDVFVKGCEVHRDGKVILKHDRPDVSYEVKEQPLKKKKEKTYKVGSDIEPGKYIALSKEKGVITWEDGSSKIFSTNFYLDLKANETINLENTELVKLEDAKSLLFNINDEGMLKVGRDIPAGKYKVSKNIKGVFAKKYKNEISRSNNEGKEVSGKEIELKANEFIYLFDKNTFVDGDNGVSEEKIVEPSISEITEIPELTEFSEEPTESSENEEFTESSEEITEFSEEALENPWTLDFDDLDEQIQPEETQWEQSESDQTKSEEMQPEQIQPEQTQPEQIQPEQTQPEQIQPEQTQEDEPQSEQTETEQVQEKVNSDEN